MSCVRQVAPRVAGVLCSAVHIWRELKERKSNTSFLVLLLVMQHCPPFPSHPQLLVPSRRTPPRPPLTKTQVEGRWAHTPHYRSSFISPATRFRGKRSRPLAAPEHENRSVISVAGCSEACRGTHCLPWHPIRSTTSGKPELSYTAFNTSIETEEGVGWGGKRGSDMRALLGIWCHMESKRVRWCWRINN